MNRIKNLKFIDWLIAPMLGYKFKFTNFNKQDFIYILQFGVFAL